MMGSFSTYRNTVELFIEMCFLNQFLLVEVSASELRTSYWDLAVHAISNENWAFDRTNHKSSVLAVIHHYLQTV